VARDARLRLWVGASAYSLCGVFHTTASMLDEIAGLLQEPLTSWDAVICPSKAILETVRRVHEAQADYLRWRLGPQVRIAAPQLPVIPLGVHCDDFAVTVPSREEARRALGLEPHEVVALYAGRLSHTTKAHPFPIYLGLQAALERTGVKVTLLECGWAMNEATTAAFREAAAVAGPNLRVLTEDGRDPGRRRNCWAAADLFISLSENIQETFGLTPLEAMAAGLPVVVTDWDGYRETVEDGVQGFRLPTWAPAEGMGAHYAAALDRGMLGPDELGWAAAASTSVDLAVLTDRLCDLILDPELRRRMGEAGRARARALYDWPVVYRQYQALWAELAERRRSAGPDVAPRLGGQADPFRAFGHYPSAHLEPGTRVSLAPGADLARYRLLADLAAFPGQPAAKRIVEPLWPRLEAGEMTVAEAAGHAGADLRTVLLAVGALAKMGLVTLR
jgi:glycosyltransferase involved in cell wall biosynthesis